MSKKIELKVQIFCEKCKTTILTTAAKIDGVNSISLDANKEVLTITGTADVVEMVKKLRKAKISAEIISLGLEKKEEKKEKKDKKKEEKEEEKKEKKDEKKEEKMIECKPMCYCHCKQPYQYGFPQYVYYEQYPESNCTIF